MQLTPEASDLDYLAQLHHFGIYARTTNAMLHTGDISELKTHISEFMAELQLTGYLRFFNEQPEKTAMRFGHKPEHFIYNHALILQNFMSNEQKLQINQCCLVFSDGPLFAFCGYNNLANTQIEPLQDILTLFFDSVASWLKQWQLKESLKVRLQNTLDKTIEANELLIDRYISSTEELTTELSHYFIQLGLDAEQESLILNALHQSTLKQAQLVEQEINRNTVLGDDLIEAVDNMLNPPEYNHLKRIISVELF